MRALLLFTILLSSLFAQDIDIKGFKIGMTFEEASKLFKLTLDHPDVSSGELCLVYGVEDITTFASVNIDSMSVGFKKKKVSDILIILKPDNFAPIIDALKDKYKITCEYSIIQNGMGTKFKQESCQYSYNEVLLLADKYAKKITESFILVSKLPSDDDIKKKKEKAKKDM